MPGHDEAELNELERALRALAPAPAPFQRDRLLFEAGRCAAPRRWLWPATSAVLGASTVCLGLLLLRPAPLPEVRVVYVERAPEPPTTTPQRAAVTEPAAPPPAPTALGPSSIWQLQQKLGPDGLGAAPETAVPLTGPAAGVILSVWDWRPRPDSALARFNLGVD